jgi:PhzF family phenazine biosynthesis protein
VSHSLHIVDAFADTPFRGNPAAVCVMNEPGEESWMQSVASEMNLSETAFLVPAGEPGSFGLRWFTPKAEVRLCGHATIGGAHVLWSENLAPANEALRFATHSGELTAVRRDGGWIELDFPALEAHETAPPMELLIATGAEPVYAGRSRDDMLIELASEDEVRRLAPDFAALLEIPNIRGLIATARATDPNCGYDFVSRFFAPAVGVNEDPVTGSAHCVLGPHWSLRLGKTELTGYQASSRGGLVKVGVAGDRIKLRGQAITVLRGSLTV